MKPIAIAMLAACLAATACAQKVKEEPRSTAAAAAVSYNRTMGSDRLFAFGKGSLQDLQQEGREQLDALVAQLQASDGQYGLVRIVGHSDRIGTDKANMALSTRRAQAVGEYLVQQGIPADKIIATGRGAYQPIEACAGVPKSALIDCLAPNRRVEITVDPPR